LEKIGCVFYLTNIVCHCQSACSS